MPHLALLAVEPDPPVCGETLACALQVWSSILSITPSVPVAYPPSCDNQCSPKLSHYPSLAVKKHLNGTLVFQSKECQCFK
jgi:hypothetical protein